MERIDIRDSSIRGYLRFWWRERQAAWIAEVLQKEENTFVDPDQRSSFKLWIQQISIQKQSLENHKVILKHWFQFDNDKSKYDFLNQYTFSSQIKWSQKFFESKMDLIVKSMPRKIR